MYIGWISSILVENFFHQVAPDVDSTLYISMYKVSQNNEKYEKI